MSEGGGEFLELCAAPKEFLCTPELLYGTSFWTCSITVWKKKREEPGGECYIYIYIYM